MDELWTYADVAEALSVSVRTVKSYVRDEKLPHVKIGRTVRFRPESVQAWIDARAVVK